MKKRLILLALNEINFEIVEQYIDSGAKLPGFKRLLSGISRSTTSEQKYSLLEPWIQWPSVHTGKKFEEHGVFRLGDFASCDADQIFEILERHGLSAGAVSPMNATNRLKHPSYFIPDPWTKTSTDGSFLSECLAGALRQSVNDNAESKLSMLTVFRLVLVGLCLIRVRKLVALFRLGISARGRKWRKALFLDQYLFEIHRSLFLQNRPDFSLLFLNGGAHIQHHYLHNSILGIDSDERNPEWYLSRENDPVGEMLNRYDDLLLELNDFNDVDVIVATGLSQKLYEQPVYYYRLCDHESFLRLLGVSFRVVEPRMTRDFLVSFESADLALIAEHKLKRLVVNDEDPLFGEIDNRGETLFVTLTYHREVEECTTIKIDNQEVLLRRFVNFVALKNGEHFGQGYSYYTEGVGQFAPAEGTHVAALHQTVLRYFGIE